MLCRVLGTVINQVANTNRPGSGARMNRMNRTNTCPLCGYDAEMTGDAHRHIFEVWQCQGCRLKFSEVGTGVEWVPAEFMVEETYSAKIWNGKENIDLEFEVKEKRECHIVCRINGVFEHEFELSICNEVEVLHVGADLVGMAGDVFPYDVVFAEKES